MSTMPILRRKIAGGLITLLFAVPPVAPCVAQTPTSTAPAAPAPAPAPAAVPPAPSVAGPVPLKTALRPAAAPPVPVPDTARPAPAGTAVRPSVPAPVPALALAPAPATAAAPANPVASARPDGATARPEQKPAPTSGPGVNEAGEAATSLRTTKLPLISLIDRSVTGRDKREIGHVIDVLVDAKGQPAALVVDVGGFMGMGNRRIAIAWERFALAGRKAKDALQLQLSDAQVKAAPAFDGSDEATVVQGAVAPPAGAPTGQAPDQAALDSSRVDLGEGLADQGAGGPEQDNAAPSADQLNPD